MTFMLKFTAMDDMALSVTWAGEREIGYRVRGDSSHLKECETF